MLRQYYEEKKVGSNADGLTETKNKENEGLSEKEIASLKVFREMERLREIVMNKQAIETQKKVRAVEGIGT